MSKEMRHLTTKIHMFEDMLLRSKNVYEIQNINNQLKIMRVQLQNLRYKESRA